jgi:inner membrane protein
VPLERRFGHRTLTYSAAMLLAVALLASPLWFFNPLYFWAVVGGYWSHLWLDMLNIRGIDLFWPPRCGWSRRAIAIGGWKSAARGK